MADWQKTLARETVHEGLGRLICSESSNPTHNYTHGDEQRGDFYDVPAHPAFLRRKNAPNQNNQANKNQALLPQ